MIAEELEATGIAIGAMDDATYEQQEVALASGDLIVLYTDGVTEAVNDQEEMFDIPRSWRSSWDPVTDCTGRWLIAIIDAV